MLLVQLTAHWSPNLHFGLYVELEYTNLFGLCVKTPAKTMAVTASAFHKDGSEQWFSPGRILPPGAAGSLPGSTGVSRMTQVGRGRALLTLLQCTDRPLERTSRPQMSGVPRATHPAAGPRFILDLLPPFCLFLSFPQWGVIRGPRPS